LLAVAAWSKRPDAVVAGADAALRVLADGRELVVIARLDTPSERAHYRHGGILPFVLRGLAPG
jgi:aconitate hydratase